MGQIELFNHLTMCKQMSDVKSNCKCYMGIFETILQCANKWLILNRTINVW